MCDPEDTAGGPGGPGGPGLSSGAGIRGFKDLVRSLSSPPPSGRLTSLRIRDLTLGGGPKKLKKVFEPNVHAVRKNKDEMKEEVQGPPKDRRERGERRQEKRMRRERLQTIQSHSIFEQGPADASRHTGWCDPTDWLYSNPPSVCKPMKTEQRESEDAEDEILHRLQRDDFIDDPGLWNDVKLNPTLLPLSQALITCGENPPPAAGSQVKAGRNPSEPSQAEQTSLADVLQGLRLSGGEELFLMQLPDCMPRRMSGLKEAAVKEGCPVLSQLPEGLLGKLQIRKSGKVELKLGDIIMDVSEGAAFSFLQLVAVRLSDGRTGDLTVLGNICHKLVLSPDFQALLKSPEAQQ
ncbi:DNA-directed RNA polymerase III subunit RPC4-like isoform X2 [Antennarius striatus]|uniref:DNA-directed RNA polymerase III subunit RPC4-like isoform X2 n=1 Tax=Antennarius striatus TaxID=241820 RepID=UPI0035B4EE9D